MLGTTSHVSLMYHDVFDNTEPKPSGFVDIGSERYKMLRSQFQDQLEVIAALVDGRSLVTDVRQTENSQRGKRFLHLTFDNGGTSFYTLIANALEAHGWIGHFFIATAMIDTPAFLNRTQIVELARRGHVIGSHSHSHPDPFSNCTPKQLRQEWQTSINILENIIDEPVTVGSVPGGFLSRQVAQAGQEAGLKFLFTSEENMRPAWHGNMRLLGRHCITPMTPLEEVQALCEANIMIQVKRACSWYSRKVLKAVTGSAYFKMRAFLLGKSG